MVRGRRTRANVAASATTVAMSRNVRHITDDQYCASPKRKDCKIDENITRIENEVDSNKRKDDFEANTCHTNGEVMLSNKTYMFGTKTRSQTSLMPFFINNLEHNVIPVDIQIDSEFTSTEDEDIDIRTIGCSTIDFTDDTCDGHSDNLVVTVNDGLVVNISDDNDNDDDEDDDDEDNHYKSNGHGEKGEDEDDDDEKNTQTDHDEENDNVNNDNINVQNNIDEDLELDQNDQKKNFTNLYNLHPITLNGQFDEIVRLSNSPKREKVGSIILLNTDSNSCDSGVVFDKQIELSPNRRRKPTTPHRILCPSPVKHAIVEKLPSNALSHLSVQNGHILSRTASSLKSSNYIGRGSPGNSGTAGLHGLGISISANSNKQKRSTKSRRRLNATPEKSSSMTPPPLVGGVILSNQTPEKTKNNHYNLSPKSVLNSAINPTAEQNSNNNFKATSQNNQSHRINGYHNIHQVRENHVYQPLNKSSSNVGLAAGGGVTNSANKKLTHFFPVRRSVRKTKKAVQEEMMRSIENAIIEGREDGLKVEHFEGKGRGIIADRVFKRGEFVVEYIGDLINTAEANTRERKYSLDENAGCYMYYFKHKNQQYCIDATYESGKLGRLVNHSRNGNLITKVVLVKNHPHLVLIAKDDIQPGEELTYDYGDRSKEALLHHPWLAL